jgi:hypothetical protein
MRTHTPTHTTATHTRTLTHARTHTSACTHARTHTHTQVHTHTHTHTHKHTHTNTHTHTTAHKLTPTLLLFVSEAFLRCGLLGCGRPSASARRRRYSHPTAATPAPADSAAQHSRVAVPRTAKCTSAPQARRSARSADVLGLPLQAEQLRQARAEVRPPCRVRRSARSCHCWYSRYIGLAQRSV